MIGLIQRSPSDPFVLPYASASDIFFNKFVAIRVLLMHFIGPFRHDVCIIVWPYSSITQGSPFWTESFLIFKNYGTSSFLDISYLADPIGGLGQRFTSCLTRMPKVMSLRPLLL
jgi:hypothetical protein